MKDILKPELVNERRRIRLGVSDITHTRVTGQHQRWPTDADSLRRIANLGTTYPRRLPNWVAVAAITVVIACGWGLVLLWASL